MMEEEEEQQIQQSKHGDQGTMENTDDMSSLDTGATVSINNSKHSQATNEDGQSGIESQSSLTYYYSSFDLFENNNPAFLKYRRFINKLQIYLGPDWVMYANQVVYRETGNPGVRQYYDNTVIFEFCLEIWLQMRRDFNRDRKNLGETSMLPSEIKMNEDQIEGNTDTQKCQEISFSMFEENEIFEQFSRQFSSSFPGCLMDQMTYKAVLHGFFLSAIETWNFILRNPTKQRQRSDSFKQVIDEYKKKIIKPIMVVSQKLTGIFGNGSKNGQINQSEARTPTQLNKNLLRSFSNFAKNINNEEEMMVEEMKKLEISSSNNNTQQLEQQQQTQTNTTPPITMKKISEQGDKAVLDFAQSYLQTIVDDTERRWQVARGFVTSIIELKYNDIQQYANNIKIRFLQPAQEFYNQLMDTYILFKSNNNTNIQFKDFLEKAKQNLGSKWSESLVIPTQVFFQTLIHQWNTILSDSANNNHDDETIIRIFVQRVRSRMAEYWDENIVRKAQENISE